MFTNSAEPSGRARHASTGIASKAMRTARSARRRRSSACLRSSMSRLTPTHFVMLPSSSRRGSARARNQRLLPSLATRRCSNWNGRPVRTAVSQAASCSTRSSGWTMAYQSTPPPVYSNRRRLKNTSEPSARLVHTWMGKVSIKAKSAVSGGWCSRCSSCSAACSCSAAASGSRAWPEGIRPFSTEFRSSSIAARKAISSVMVVSGMMLRRQDSVARRNSPSGVVAAGFAVPVDPDADSTQIHYRSQPTTGCRSGAFSTIWRLRTCAHPGRDGVASYFPRKRRLTFAAFVSNSKPRERKLRDSNAEDLAPVGNVTRPGIVSVQVFHVYCQRTGSQRRGSDARASLLR